MINFGALGDVEIALIGNTQIGKSTFINSVLQSNLAEVGDGTTAGITKGFMRYKHPTYPVVFWDSKGIEVKNSVSQIKSVTDWFFRRERETDPYRMPFVLLCVSEEEPIQGFHRYMFDWFCGHMAVIVVLLKAKKKNNAVFLQAAKDSFPGARICRVNSIETYYDESDPDAGKYAVRGFAELSEAMISATKGGKLIRKDWLGAVSLCVRMKDNAMAEIPSIAKWAGWKTGLNPIPFLDDIHVPTALRQIIEACSKCFSVQFSKSFVEQVVGDNKSPHKGKGLLKYLPYVGCHAALYLGFSAHDFVLAFGRKFVMALYKECLEYKIDKGDVEDFERQLFEELHSKKG